MKTATTTLMILTFASIGFQCATAAPPSELLSARAAYQHAEASGSATLDPAELDTAKKALAEAERAFQAEGDTLDVQDLAYIAGRRSQLAEARGHVNRSMQAQKASADGMHADQATQLHNTSAELDRVNQRLELQGQAMQHQSMELATEQGARADAEKRASDTAAQLAKIAATKQESRGLVITLPGGVMFETSKSALLLGAELKLNDLAEILIHQDVESKVTVEGHTDSQGGMSYNQDLSQRRAQTVRDYLVSRGIAADRLTSQGFGSSRSVADNGSAEGRAENRRVEIVVTPKVASAM